MALSVLVVEDDTEVLGNIQSLLEGAGYVVHHAANGEEAIALLARIPRPCMVLWDAVPVHDNAKQLEPATFDGIRVATVPIAVECDPKTRLPRKRLVGGQAMLAMLRQHGASSSEIPDLT
jgi:CheY-like chemotaxis protein